MMDSAEAYEIHAHEFLLNRDKSEIGSLVVERWGRTLRQDAALIELACGGGYPITRVLRSVGLRIWAVDSSPTLVAEFKNRFPAIPVQCAKVQECDFFGRTYDAAIAIGLIFLLPEPDQLTFISRISEIVVPGGRFLFTAPIERGAWKDMTTGLESRSLGQESYEKHLSEAGFRVLTTFIDKGANNYYDAERL